MKKTLIFTVLASLAMASCSQDEITDTNSGAGIGFRPSVGKTTRATALDLTNMEAFHVTALGNGANYFTNLAVRSTDGGNSWKTDATYYWPSYGLEFFAYAPTTLTGASVDNTAQKLDFTLNETITAQEDLLVSYNTGTKADNEGKGVALNFKHALSQITVSAKCPNDNMRVEVLGVKICQIGSKATFAFPKDETKADYTLAQSQWSNMSATKDFIVKGTAPVTLTKDAAPIMFDGNAWMVIPQTLTAWDGTSTAKGAYLSVLCRIYSLDGGNATLLYPKTASGDDKAGLYGFSAVGIATDWQPGKKYAYTLEFFGTDGGGGKVDPDPTNPVNPTDPDVDPDPNPGGEDILGNPIKFTVKVDDWGTAVDSDVAM